MKVKSEDKTGYAVSPAPLQSAYEDDIIQQALAILQGRFRKPEFYMTSPEQVRQYLQLKIATLEHEVFGVMFLDNRHGLIEAVELFRGTVDGASVYPREVVKEALARNSAAVILYHNHPSGNPEPSQADLAITQRLREALVLVEVKTLDHLIIGHDRSTSLAERGLI